MTKTNKSPKALKPTEFVTELMFNDFSISDPTNKFFFVIDYNMVGFSTEMDSGYWKLFTDFLQLQVTHLVDGKTLSEIVFDINDHNNFDVGVDKL
jgi:hypothetical protein